MLHYSPKKHGFTLVEIMIVVAIIGILAGIMVPNFMKARAEAKLSACQGNMKAIATAYRTYEIRHKIDRSISVERLVDEGYLKKVPSCPAGGWYSIPTHTYSNGEYVVKGVYCCGQKHGAAGITGSFYGYSFFSGKFSDQDKDLEPYMW